MKDALKNTAFALVMLIYIGFPISKIIQQENVLEQGTLYKFRPQPVDPYDAFRGRYIVLNIDAPSFEVSPDDRALYFQPGRLAHVTLEKDAEGFARFNGIQSQVPDSGDYLSMFVNYTDDKKVWLQIPESFSRYYLNEKLAPLAEKKYNELLRDLEQDEIPRVVVEAKILNGRGLIKQLYFDEMPVEKYLRLEN